jgi:putative DNA primase/helicase
VRRIIAEGADEIGETVRNMVAAFIETAAPAGSDGQIDRAAQRLGLIAAAGELATALEIVPWRAGEARDAAALALSQWIDGRGGTESDEVRQAIEQVSREWMIPPEVWKTEICNGLDAWS